LCIPAARFGKIKTRVHGLYRKENLSESEDPLDAAKREFKEETGINCEGNFIELSPVKLKSGKMIFAWALEKDINPDLVKSNFFEMEWPPKSGKKMSFPEIDKGGWFSPAEAKQKINATQSAFIDELLYKI
jgi:predicted NUDIX family NTP pyrophosphohydrolase